MPPTPMLICCSLFTNRRPPARTRAVAVGRRPDLRATARAADPYAYICCSPTEVLVMRLRTFFVNIQLTWPVRLSLSHLAPIKKQFFCPVLPVTFGSHKNSACGRHSRCEAGSETSSATQECRGRTHATKTAKGL